MSTNLDRQLAIACMSNEEIDAYLAGEVVAVEDSEDRVYRPKDRRWALDQVLPNAYLDRATGGGGR